MKLTLIILNIAAFCMIIYAMICYAKTQHYATDRNNNN